MTQDEIVKVAKDVADWIRMAGWNHASEMINAKRHTEALADCGYERIVEVLTEKHTS